MQFEDQGWLKRYLDYRQQFQAIAGHKKSEEGVYTSSETSLYQVLQPTGLMYGQPLSLPNSIKPQSASWENGDRTKIILTESFINCALLSRQDFIQNPNDIADIILNSTSGIVEYYNQIYPDLYEPARLFFFKKKPTSNIEMAEYILSKRIDIQSGTINHFWGGFFHNSLLFLDVYYYGKWVKAQGTPAMELIRKEQEAIRFTILKIIVASAHADQCLELEEKSLFEYFLDSTHFSADKRKEAEEVLKRGVSIDEIEIPSISSWILKKYLLELALLTIWVDKSVSDAEKAFLKKLNEKLGFSDDELDNSALAIESFVLEHWEEVHYLNNKENYHIIRDRFLERLSNVADKNKNRIQQEINENKHLLELLAKAKRTNLNAVEQEQLQKALIDILKVVPTFYIIALPGTVLNLPILLKIIPEGAFPVELKG